MKQELERRLDDASHQDSTFARSAFRRAYEVAAPQKDRILGAIEELLGALCQIDGIPTSEGERMDAVLRAAVEADSVSLAGTKLTSATHTLRGHTLMALVEDVLSAPRKLIEALCTRWSLRWDEVGSQCLDALLRGANRPHDKGPTAPEIASLLCSTSITIDGRVLTLTQIAAEVGDPRRERLVSVGVLAPALELSRVIATRIEVQDAALALVDAFCTTHSIDWDPHGRSFYEALTQDATAQKPNGQDRDGRQVAERMWTTDEPGVPKLVGRHAFYHIVNEGVRAGAEVHTAAPPQDALMFSAVRFSRALNKVTVTRGANATPWPAGNLGTFVGPAPPGTVLKASTAAHTTFRGGGFKGELA